MQCRGWLITNNGKKERNRKKFGWGIDCWRDKQYSELKEHMWKEQTDRQTEYKCVQCAGNWGGHPPTGQNRIEQQLLRHCHGRWIDTGNFSPRHWLSAHCIINIEWQHWMNGNSNNSNNNRFANYIICYCLLATSVVDAAQIRRFGEKE